ncbi:hypothetical protein [Streptomyces pseudoechinosporeus]
MPGTAQIIQPYPPRGQGTKHLLKYAEFDTDFIAEFPSVATRENL